MINIKPKHLKIIKNILTRYDYSFYVFGSRITKNVKELSDLDLFYIDDIPKATLLKLEEAFEESDLPYKVDVVDYKICDSDFQAIMRKNYVLLQAGSKGAKKELLFKNNNL